MPKVRFVVEAEAAGVATHTGKIKSSRRITKAMQVAIDKGEPVEYTFDDGTVGTIEPSMAKLALSKYNSLSPFERAQAASFMRGSFKNYIRSVKGE